MMLKVSSEPIHMFLQFAIAAVSSVLFCWAVLRFAAKRGWVSAVDFRRKQPPVPLLGGFGLVLATAVTSFVIWPHTEWKLWALCLPMVFLGAADDIFEIRPRLKLFGQIFAVGIWFYFTPASELLLLRLGAPEWIAVGLTLFWIVGIVNAVNMIDGMDMSAAGFAFFAAVGLAKIGGVNTEAYLIFAGAIAGFMYWNRPPAKLYLGETGSAWIGFFLATSAATVDLDAHSAGVSPWVLVSVLFVFSVPEIDAVLSMVRRYRARIKLSSGDRDHLHHKLLKVGFTTRQALFVLMGVTVYSSLVGVLLVEASSFWIQVGIAFMGVSSMLSILGALYFLEHRQATQVSTFTISLIAKHLGDQPRIDKLPNDFRAVLYDLLPYYKELQGKGIVHVESFVQDFADLINRIHSKGMAKVLGSYSLLMVEDLSNAETKSREEIVREFYKFVDKHGVQKNSDGDPWGVTVYASEFGKHAFMKRFGKELGLLEIEKKAG